MSVGLARCGPRVRGARCSTFALSSSTRYAISLQSLSRMACNSSASLMLPGFALPWSKRDTLSSTGSTDKSLTREAEKGRKRQKKYRNKISGASQLQFLQSRGQSVVATPGFFTGPRCLRTRTLSRVPKGMCATRYLALQSTPATCFPR